MIAILDVEHHLEFSFLKQNASETEFVSVIMWKGSEIPTQLSWLLKASLNRKQTETDPVLETCSGKTQHDGRCPK
jgi:hypothetical protein